MGCSREPEACPLKQAGPRGLRGVQHVEAMVLACSSLDTALIVLWQFQAPWAPSASASDLKCLRDRAIP